MKDIPGFEGLYAITEDGRVWSYPKSWITGRENHSLSHKGFFKKARLDGRGYYCIELSKNKKVSPHKIHRLIAKTYIANPKNYPLVNHKNHIRNDNRIENLEWCTYSQNNLFYRNHYLKLAVKLLEDFLCESCKLKTHDI